MSCSKLTYQPEYLPVQKEATREKSDTIFFENLGEKRVRPEKSENYYPFGLQAAASWTRENVTGNNFLANGGTELNPASALYDLDFRNYDPVLGRMNQVDPMADIYSSQTPYNFAFNRPAVLNDPKGDDPRRLTRLEQETGVGIGWSWTGQIKDSGVFGRASDGTSATQDRNILAALAVQFPEASFGRTGEGGFWIKLYSIDQSTENIPEGMLATITERSLLVSGISMDHFETMRNPIVQAFHKGQQAFVDNPFGGGMMAFLMGGSVMGAGGIVGRAIIQTGRSALPGLRALLFARNLTKAKMLTNATAEAINQYAVGNGSISARLRNLDVFDIAAQSVLGFNTFGSVIATSSINYQPFMTPTDNSFYGWSSSLGTAKGTSDLAFSGIAGMISDKLGSKLPVGSGIILMTGVDWMAKFEANQLTKN